MAPAHTDGPGSVRVADVVDQLDMLSEGVQVYLDLETHEFVTVLDPSVFGDDVAADQVDPEDLEPGRFAALPDAFDVHEWAILRAFCEEVEDPDLRARLLRAVHGRGAALSARALTPPGTAPPRRAGPRPRHATTTSRSPTRCRRPA